MKKNLKKILLTTLSLAALGVVATAVGTNAGVKVSAESLDYYMDGAGVKFASETDENVGIRFHMLMSNEKYSTVAKEGITIGTLIIPTDLLTDTDADGLDYKDFNLNTANAKNGVTYSTEEGVSEWSASSLVEGYMETYVYLYDIPAQSSNRSISAIGYIDNGATVEYTSILQRSMAGVAYAAVKDGADASSLSMYLSREYSVDFLDEEGVVVSSENYQYGDTFATPEIPTAIDKTFLGCKYRVGTKDGEAVWSDGYYDFTKANALFVAGNMQFKAEFADYGSYAPAFGSSYGYAVTIAKTDLPVGTVVDVTATFSFGFDSNANGSWLAYENSAAKITGLTNTNTSFPINIYNYSFAEDVWKTFSFTTTVKEGGLVQVSYRLADPSKSKLPETVYFKDVTVNTQASDYGEVAIKPVAGTYRYMVALGTSSLPAGTKLMVTADLRFTLTSVQNASLIRWATADGKVDTNLPSLTGQAGTATGPEQVTSWTTYTFTAYVQNDGTFGILLHTPNGKASGTETVFFKNVRVASDMKTYSGSFASGSYSVKPAVVLATTEFAEGSKVNVSMLMSYAGTAAKNNSLWTRYYTSATAATAISQPGDASKWNGWQRVSFTCYVQANGEIWLDIRNNSGSAYTYVVDVAEIVITQA